MTLIVTLILLAEKYEPFCGNLIFCTVLLSYLDNAYLLSACHHTSCLAVLHLHSCCRTSWKSWRLRLCRGTPPLLTGPQLTLAGGEGARKGCCDANNGQYHLCHPIFTKCLICGYIRSVYLFAIVCDWGENSTQCLKAHGNVQKMGSKEEVVIVTQNGHGHVPGQIQEGLQGRQVEIQSRHCSEWLLQWATSL